MSNIFLGLPIAIQAGENLLSKIFELYPDWRHHSGLKWTGADNYHLTLHFFGSIHLELLSDLVNDLESVLKNINNFSIKINKIYNFPEVNSKILAGYVSLSSPLAHLYHLIEKTVLSHQLPCEKRPYLPHITLCRARRKGILKMEPLWLEDFELPVTEVILYQTRSTPQGSQYQPIQRWSLR